MQVTKETKDAIAATKSILMQRADELNARADTLRVEAQGYEQLCDESYEESSHYYRVSAEVRRRAEAL
jgi:hypothetical protein